MKGREFFFIVLFFSDFDEKNFADAAASKTKAAGQRKFCKRCKFDVSLKFRHQTGILSKNLQNLLILL